MDNVLEFWVDPINALKRAACSNKVVAGFFDEEGFFRAYIGSEMTYQERLLALDTFERIMKSNEE